jgi:hypothetical protein
MGNAKNTIRMTSKLETQEQDLEITTVSLRISKNLAERIYKRLSKGAEFDTIDSYTEFVLETVLNQVESEDSNDGHAIEVFSERDQEDVRAD